MNTNSRNVTYSTVGDYLLPNLTLNQPRKPLGKYGRLRRTYLKQHRPVLYHTMLDEAGLQKLPKVKELDAEFAELLTKKKASYPDYRKARNEMQELVRAQKNVERFFAEEKDTTEKTQTR